MEITYSEASVKTEPAGSFELNVQFDGKNALLFALNSWVLPHLKKEAEDQDSDTLRQAVNGLCRHMETIDQYVNKLAYKRHKKGIKFDIKSKDIPDKDRDEVVRRIQEALADTFVQHGVLVLEDLHELKRKREDKGHKQSRSLARTIARSAGKDTSQPSLFSMPFQNLKEELERKLAESPDGKLTKENISQKTSTLALLLVCKYDELPKNEDGSISISDVGGLAAQMKTTVQEMKYMLLYLSGFQYPHVAHYSESKEIGFRMSKLFDIEFFYDQKHEKKIELTGAHLRVEGVLDIVRNVRIKRLQVKPTPQFIRDLKGKGAGYIQIPATDAYLAMCHDLTLMAFKLMNYSMANRSDWKIGEDKLIEALGIQDMLKKQGRPRTQAAIRKGLEELKRNGHLSEFQTPAETGGPYTWKCDGKYAISQQDKQQKAKEGQEFIDIKDKSIPVERRRQHYAEHMRKKYRMGPDKAAQKAVERIPE